MGIKFRVVLLDKMTTAAWLRHTAGSPHAVRWSPASRRAAGCVRTAADSRDDMSPAHLTATLIFQWGTPPQRVTPHHASLGTNHSHQWFMWTRRDQRRTAAANSMEQLIIQCLWHAGGSVSMFLHVLKLQPDSSSKNTRAKEPLLSYKLLTLATPG